MYVIFLIAADVAAGFGPSRRSRQPGVVRLGPSRLSFGLRHAVDADHIAAIDNVTRKLMQQGDRPVSVGFFFSLGHSLVLIIGVGGVTYIIIER